MFALYIGLPNVYDFVIVLQALYNYIWNPNWTKRYFIYITNFITY